MTHTAKHTFTRRPLLLTLLSATLAIAACGGGGGGGGGGGSSSGSSGGGSGTPPVTPAWSLELVAGHIGGSGNAEGTGSLAAFHGPRYTAVDSVGNVFVADYENSRIRKITPAGVVSTFGSKIERPSVLAIDGSNNVYVANAYAIHKITPSGASSVLAGDVSSNGSQDGAGTAARFNRPEGLAFDPTTGGLFVSDTQNHTIRRITMAGVVTTVAGAAGIANSTDNATGAQARFNEPKGLATDSAGNVYIADYSNYTIRKIDTSGAVSTVAGLAGNIGTTEGVGNGARFWRPTSVVVAAGNNLFVTDAMNSIRKIDPTGQTSKFAGGGSNSGTVDGDGAGTAAGFGWAVGISKDTAGNLYVADMLGQTIRKITAAAVVTTIAGQKVRDGSANGTLSSALFAKPQGAIADGSGNVYIADNNNHVIRQISAAGTVSTWLGAVGDDNTVNGTGASVRFASPSSMVKDSAGNLFVLQSGWNNIRKINIAGVVSTFAGDPNGTQGSTDATGTNARFYQPSAMAIDSNDNVYVADRRNYTVRKVTPAGVVSTLAGAAGANGNMDAIGSSARFENITGLAVANGHLFVADSGNYTVRKVELATGAVSTFAGSGVEGGQDGMGTAAKFGSQTSMAADTKGNLYVFDNGTNTVRKITPVGLVSTMIGKTGVLGFQPGNPGVLRDEGYLSVVGNNLYIAMGNGIAVVRNLP